MSLSVEQILDLETQVKTLGISYTIQRDRDYFTSRIVQGEKVLKETPGHETAWDALDSVMADFNRVVSLANKTNVLNDGSISRYKSELD